MRIRKTSQYIEGGATLSNTYGTSQKDGYTQEYTNNLYDNRNTYAFTETVVGKWINKPLYRKVISVTLTNGFASSSAFTQNLGHSHIATAWIEHNDLRVTIPAANVSANWQTRCFINTNFVQIQNNNTDYVGDTAYVVVEYTKTTD